MIKNVNKHDKTAYGVIKRLVSPYTSEIQTRVGQVIRLTSLTVPLAPACLMSDAESVAGLGVNIE